MQVKAYYLLATFSHVEKLDEAEREYGVLTPPLSFSRAFEPNSVWVVRGGGVDRFESRQIASPGGG